MPTLSDLVSKLPRIYKGNMQALDTEWRLLDCVMLPDMLREKCEVVPFYQRLLCVMDENDEPQFKHLATFVLQILSLPVSNSDAERLFSKVNLIKTDIRNKLKTKSVAALIHMAEAVKEQESCFLFKPTDAMMNC